MSDMIRILIVDDHPVVRHGLRGMLSLKPGLEVVGEAEDGEEAVLQARLLQPDVILLDLMMPRKDGLAVIQALKQEAHSANILVLTSLTGDEKLLAAIEAGALGCLLKDSSPQELVRAIRDVAQGELTLHPAIARKLLRGSPSSPETGSPHDRLTEREIDVLKLMAQGLSNRDIAETLVISDQTVRGHVSNILEKLQLANRTQAVLYALRQGIASLNS
ncbi:MAG: response regulator transcription factor [Anaerolineaceae bacterium]|nr:response regulator transcription factor [Anaerolineaceae bacterium]